MELKEPIFAFGEFLNTDEMTFRQMMIIIGFWMGLTALTGIVAYIIIFQL